MKELTINIFAPTFDCAAHLVLDLKQFFDSTINKIHTTPDDSYAAWILESLAADTKFIINWYSIKSAEHDFANINGAWAYLKHSIMGREFIEQITKNHESIRWF